MDPHLIHQDDASIAQDSLYDEHDEQIDEQSAGVNPAHVSEQPDPSQPASEQAKQPRPKPKKQERELGKTLLPAARIQKILKADKEMSGVGKDALVRPSDASALSPLMLNTVPHIRGHRTYLPLDSLLDLTMLLGGIYQATRSSWAPAGREG